MHPRSLYCSHKPLPFLMYAYQVDLLLFIRRISRTLCFLSSLSRPHGSLTVTLFYFVYYTFLSSASSRCIIRRLFCAPPRLVYTTLCFQNTFTAFFLPLGIQYILLNVSKPILLLTYQRLLSLSAVSGTKCAMPMIRLMPTTISVVPFSPFTIPKATVTSPVTSLIFPNFQYIVCLLIRVYPRNPLLTLLLSV